MITITCFFAALYFILLVVFSTYYKHKVNGVRAKAFEDAAHVAQLWIINKYGIKHECSKVTNTCDEIHQLADKLRELSKK